MFAYVKLTRIYNFYQTYSFNFKIIYPENEIGFAFFMTKIFKILTRKKEKERTLTPNKYSCNFLLAKEVLEYYFELRSFNVIW